MATESFQDATSRRPSLADTSFSALSLMDFKVLLRARSVFISAGLEARVIKGELT